MRRNLVMLLGTSILLLCVSGAFAVSLAPAGSVAGTDLGAGFAGTGAIIASTIVTDPSPVGNVAGTFRLAVFQEGGAGGNLDFLYQFITGTTSLGAPSDTIRRVTGNKFDSFTTDVGYVTSNGGSLAFFAAPTTTAGNAFPDTVDRSLDGNIVGFNWSLANAFRGTSDILVVRTNAKTFSTGFASAIDGGSTGVTGYQPAPEPAFAGLLLAGLFGAGLFLARRFQVLQN